MIGWLVNNELERIYEETVQDYWDFGLSLLFSILQNIMFQNWICFHPQVRGWEPHTLLSLLRIANFNQWTSDQWSRMWSSSFLVCLLTWLGSSQFFPMVCATTIDTKWEPSKIFKRNKEYIWTHWMMICVTMNITPFWASLVKKINKNKNVINSYFAFFLYRTY
jgi:hypothetical protein